jgi:hypothetical protein
MAAETPLWEPGKVVSVEQVSTPAKTPDPDCRSVPRGTTPPPHCRSSYLRAQQFWRVTVDVGNKRFVVRPYRAPKLINSLSDDGAEYVDPGLAAATPVEVAVLSNKAVRLRTDQGKGLPAIVDSQVLLSKAEAPVRTERPEPAPAPRARAAAAPAPRVATPVGSSSKPLTSGPRVVLLENSDFVDLDVQEFKSQDIGDGAALYSFSGDAAHTRIGSNPPVFLVLADGDAEMGRPELSRLQAGKGTRQIAYSLTKNRSASSLAVTVTQVSATVQKIRATEPLPPGEYVVLVENSNRGFLFAVR